MGVNKRLIGAGAAGSPLPFAGQNFKHVSYTGDNSTGRAITGVGFKPDLIFIKPRNQTEHWNAYDTTRGAQKQLLPNTSAASTTQTQSIQSFDADGWTMNGDNNVNKTGINYSAWCWKANGGTTSSNSNGSITSTVQANTAAGFSIVQWTGTGSNATIGHGLSSAPEWLVVKKTNASGTDWVWKNDVQLGAARGLYLNDDVGEQTDSTFWQSASPTSTVFSVGTSDKTNGSGNTYIAYCWHSVAGFSNSTTGSQYTGTGDSDGPIVSLGFEPSIIIIKSKDGSPTTDWKLYTKDTNEHLSINTNGQAGTNSGNNKIDFLSNGFKISGNDADINASGQSYNYYAYAADPDTEAPTLASSFNIELYRGNSSTNSITGLGFSPNFVWNKARTDERTHNLFDTVRGAGELLTANNNNAESTTSTFNSFDSDGFTVSGSDNFMNNSSHDYVAWTWKADDNEPTINTNGTINTITSVNDNAGFSIVKWTGTGSSGTLGHGLSTAPKFIIVKSLSNAFNWYVYTTATGTHLRFEGLNTNGTGTSGTSQFTTTSTLIENVPGISSLNGSGEEMIAYCFSEVSNYQKFGTYTGNNTDDTAITVGFQPDFVIIKSTTTAENWSIMDSRRGGHVRMYANTNDDDEATTGFSFTSTGFVIPRFGSFNHNGATFLYWAIAKNVPSINTLAGSFKTIEYTGNQSTLSISGVGFKSDLIWLKETSGTDRHVLIDTIRGEDSQISTNSADAATTFGSNFESFDTDGFTLGDATETNGNGETYAAWCWKAGNEWQLNTDGAINSTINANTGNGFSIVRYHGTGSTTTVGHGLGAVPEWIIVKNLSNNHSGNAHWAVYHKGIGETKVIYLNRTNAVGTSNAFWNDTAPTSTVFSIGTDNDVNVDGEDFIAYCWDSVSNFSSIGSYTGNGSAGQTITTGFKPDWVLIKSTVGTANWHLYDTVRNRGLNQFVQPNNTDAQEEHIGNTNPHLEMTSTGFSITADGVTQGNNTNGNLYIYAAFAMNPTLNTTLANSFKTVTYTGTGSATSITSLGFKPDLIWIKDRGRTREHIWSDSVRGANREISSNTSDAEEKDRGVSTFDTDGFSFLDGNTNYNDSGESYVAWCWKAGNNYVSNIDGSIPSIVNANTANGFSIVKWTGTGAINTVGHGLSAAPEMILIKDLDSTSDWQVYAEPIGNGNKLSLNSSAAASSTTRFDSTSPTSTVFTLRDIGLEGGLIAYCFHSVSGYSKIGSYTGTGSSNSITGLGFQPDFVIIKNTDSARGWQMFDSVRGVNQVLFANSDSDESSEAAGTSLSSFDSDGFTVGTGNGVNENGDTFIYMAFK